MDKNYYSVKIPYQEDIFVTSGPVPRVGELVGFKDIGGTFKVTAVHYLYDKGLRCTGSNPPPLTLVTVE